LSALRPGGLGGSGLIAVVGLVGSFGSFGLLGGIGLLALPRSAAAATPPEMPASPPAPTTAAAQPATTPPVQAPATTQTPSEMPAPAPPRLAPSSGAPPSSIHEAAPRPEAAIRVQPRFAVKAKLTEIYGGFEYLSRGDFYNSPGLRVGGVYYLFEPLGLEVQLAHDWSSLDATAERAKAQYGLLPDSHPPGLRAMVGARYSIGYGKLMVGGLGGVIHFEPQAFLHAGIHDNAGEVGPSSDAGLGFLVFLTSKLFVRVDAAVTLDFESRSGTTIGVWGALPALSAGGTL
jgi:hypothetical protein